MIDFGRLFKPAVSIILAGQPIHNLDGDGLRIAFSVTKTVDATPDSAMVSVYNLHPKRRQLLGQAFSQTGVGKLTIGAGYDKALSRLFLGDVRKMSASERVGVDWITTAVADDAGDALADVTFLKPFPTAGQTVAQLINLGLATLAEQGVPIRVHPSVQVAINATSPAATASLFNFVSVGKVSQLFDECARTLDCRWWVAGGMLFMSKLGTAVKTPGDAVRVPRTHWLSEPTDDGLGITRMDTLFMPAIAPGHLFALEGRKPALEPFRVESCVYSGDTATGPWRCSVALRRTTG